MEDFTPKKYVLTHKKTLFFTKLALVFELVVFRILQSFHQF